MNNIVLLIKTDILILKNRIAKNNRKKSLAILLLTLFGVFSIVGTLTLQSYALLSQLKGSGLESYAISMQVLMSLFLTFLFAIMNSLTLTEKDTAFLLSLPIRKKDIVLSKTLLKYFFDFLIFFGLIFPTLILYFVMIEANILILINGILLILILPFIVIGFTFLFNSFINTVIIKFKFYKLLRTFILLLSFLGFMVLYYYCMIPTSSAGASLEMPLISPLIKIILENNYVNLAILFLITSIVFTSGVFTFSALYGKGFKTYKNEGKKVVYNVSNGVIQSIIKKELRNYFSSTMYLFNTIIGYLLLLGLSIGLYFIDFNFLIEMLAYLVVAFSLSTCCISNISLSLEGKNFWILKGAPIKPKTIIYAKALTNMLLLFIVLTISITIALFSGKISIKILFLIYLLGLASSVFVSFGGIFINMFLPKLDFKNETEVVKRSASVMISLLFFMIFFMFMPVLYLSILHKFIPLDIVILINAGFIILLDMVLIKLCGNLAEKKLIKL